MLCDFWAQASKGLTVATLILLKSDSHYEKEKLIILLRKEKHREENQTLQPKVPADNMWMEPGMWVNPSWDLHPHLSCDDSNHKSDTQQDQ